VVSGTGEWGVTAIRPGVSPARALSCVRLLGEGEDTRLDDHAAVRAGGGDVWALAREGLVLVGSEEGVRRALAALAAPSRAALATVGFRKYLDAAKTAEARRNLGFVGYALLSYVQNERANKRPALFPPSAPAVPKDVPRGQKYQSSATDWSHSTWQALKFSID